MAQCGSNSKEEHFLRDGENRMSKEMGLWGNQLLALWLSHCGLPPFPVVICDMGTLPGCCQN